MKLSWKAPALLAAILLVALGLQASGIKILLDLSRQPEPDRAAREPEVAPPVSTTQEADRWPAIDPPPPDTRDPVTRVDPPHLTDLATAARPAATEASPPDPAPAPAQAPASDAAALAMARLAELAEQTAVAPTQPAIPEPMPNEPVEPATPESTPVEPTPVAGLQGAAWLEARDPRRYTIQLISGKDLNRLKDTAATVTSDEPQAYYTTGSRTSPWYSLVMGDYPDAAAARAAAANLSASSSLKPWVRRFEDIQSSMR